MDYIRRTFELRSIIRNYAIKSLEVLSLSLLSLFLTNVRDYTYICAGDTTWRGTARVLCPRISIKTSNFIFKFRHHHRAHRSCSLSPSSSSSFIWGTVSFFHVVLLLLRFFPFSFLGESSRYVRWVSPSVFPSFPSRKTDHNRNESFNLLTRLPRYFRDVIRRYIWRVSLLLSDTFNGRQLKRVA